MFAHVIYGENLIKVSRYTDLDPEFVKLIDPKGWNLLHNTMLHNDREIRAEVMFKVKGEKHPVESSMTIDLIKYNEVVQKVDPNSGKIVQTNN